MLWSYPCLADVLDLTQIGQEILLFPLWCLIELDSPSVLGCGCFQRLNGRSSSIKHESKRKPKRMSLIYYLSTTCVVVQKKKVFSSFIFDFFYFCLFCFQPGWEERVHTDGRTFYIDHSKRTLCSSNAFIHLCLSS